MNPLKDSFVRIVKEWNKLPNHLLETIATSTEQIQTKFKKVDEH